MKEPYYLFVDESGDLGNSEGSPPWFVFAAIGTSTPDEIPGFVLRKKKDFNKPENWDMKGRELKPWQLDNILQEMCQLSIHAYVEAAKKAGDYWILGSDRSTNVRQNELLSRFLAHTMKKLSGVVRIRVDKSAAYCDNKNEREHFLNNSDLLCDKFDFALLESQNSPGIQLADVVAYTFSSSIKIDPVNENRLKMINPILKLVSVFAMTHEHHGQWI